MISDTQMLNWLEKQNAKAEYTGRCVFRWSIDGRGWRLHETSGHRDDACTSVRDAIESAMRKAGDA